MYIYVYMCVCVLVFTSVSIWGVEGGEGGFSLACLSTIIVNQLNGTRYDLR